MNIATPLTAVKDLTDSSLVDLVDEVIRRVQAGEAIDPDVLAGDDAHAPSRSASSCPPSRSWPTWAAPQPPNSPEIHPPRAMPDRGWARSATSICSARSAAVAWASSTRRDKSHSIAGWR